MHEGYTSIKGLRLRSIELSRLRQLDLRQSFVHRSFNIHSSLVDDSQSGESDS